VASNRRAVRVISLTILGLIAYLPSAGAQRLSGDRIEALVARQLPGAFEAYRELLSLPNDAHFPEDILELLSWLERAFERRDFATTRLPTGGSPVLLAERSFPGASRTVLIYLQADGQPVDPSAWNQESPYRPVLKEDAGQGGWSAIPWERLRGEWEPGWRVFARSASDSKGPIAQFLTALDAMDDGGVTPDFNMKVIVDTEEEMGSPNLPAAVERYRERLAADMLVIFDGPPHVSNRPTLKFGARGIARATLTTFGPRTPQHSGHYGNYAPNPALRLAELLASMKDDRGRVTIPGWYDGVVLDPDTKAMLARVPDDENQIRERLGIVERDLVGDNLQEAVQYPSLNIRGMSSGWIGAEARTIVPATATAEIDIRLVKESNPERLLGLLRNHVEERGYYLVEGAPTEAERMAYPKIASFTASVSYLAFRTPFDSEPGRWLTGAFVNLYGEEPIKIRTSGGSIPISPFVQTLGIPAVGVPTVNGDNNQHSPNENLRVGSFVEGIKIMLAVLAEPL
jgi:acetylornithine deacetylase/succinyl-diaminopimelate desuccinylase-like protein